MCVCVSDRIKIGDKQSEKRTFYENFVCLPLFIGVRVCKKICSMLVFLLLNCWLGLSAKLKKNSDQEQIETKTIKEKEKKRKKYKNACLRLKKEECEKRKRRKKNPFSFLAHSLQTLWLEQLYIV